MLRSDIGARGLLGCSRTSRVRATACRVTRAVRPVRHPRLGVRAFKDWFSGLVQHKEPQPQQVAQPAPQDQHAPTPQPVAAVGPPKVAPKRDFLEARQVSLFQLFDSSDYKFDIPAYQRPYAWRTKQIYELLQDFVKAYELRQEYFLGAIVATKAADGAHVPYQLIDGQQRLTSLVVLLAFLHGWAREQGNEVLEGRIRRMLYLETDPLDPDSRGRYRLRLRDADDAFFRTNVLDSFLPNHFRLAGVAAAAGSSDGAAAAGGTTTGWNLAAAAAAEGAPGAAAATLGGQGAEGAVAQPLENETWWRLYENAAFLRSQLDKLVAEGLNLQDFTFHVLRNCFVVMMVARDEGASFRIFSTLNGRGMDLSVVDKLKADLLAGDLSPEERSHFADAWAEMESVLGRSAFHRVFDYMRDLAAVRDPWVGETSVLEYFTRKVDDPRAVKQIMQVSLDYARLLLQLRQASWAVPELAALLAETPREQEAQQQQQQEEEEAVRQPLTWHREDAGEEGGNGGGAAGAAAEEARGGTAAFAHAGTNGVGQEQVKAAVAAVREEEEGVLVFSFGDPAGVGAVTVAVPAPAVTDGDGAVDGVVAGADVVVVPALEAAATPFEAAVSVGELDVGVASAAAAATAGADVTAAAAQLLKVEGSPMAAAAAEVVAETVAAELEPAPWAAMTAAEAVTEAVTVMEAETAPVLAPAAPANLPLSHPWQQQQHQLQVEEAEESSADAGVSAGAEDTTAAVAAAAFSASLSASESMSRAVEAAEEAAEAALDAERARQAALLAELDERSRHLNLFADEAWLPPLLEFFYQTEDLEHRVAFMKGAEALQLFLELWNDPAAKAARWGVVSEALLQRPLSPEDVLSALRLTDAEKEAFKARLDSKDLYGTTDQRTLRHLLVRCEPPEVARHLSGASGLLVEKVVPQSPPEGSMWRKTRIATACDPQSPWPEAWYNSPRIAAAAPVPAATASNTAVASTAAVTGDAERPQQQPEHHHHHHNNNNSNSSAGSAQASYDVKYWYEVQRLNWHGKLGNLVLLPATAASAASSSADYDVKAALWRRGGVGARLPGFTGPLVDEQGRYGRFKFCYEECRQRHEDMLERLTTVFELY